MYLQQGSQGWGLDVDAVILLGVAFGGPSSRDGNPLGSHSRTFFAFALIRLF